MIFTTPIVRVVKKVSENKNNIIIFDFLYEKFKESDYINNHKIYAFKRAKNLIIISLLLI